MTNHSGLRDTELAGYSPIATHRIFLYGSGHGLGIYSFTPISLSVVIEVLATRAKFLEQYGFSIVINGVFTFHGTNVFGCFHGVMAQFKLIKHKLISAIFKIIPEVKQHSTCQRTDYHETTDYSGYLPRRPELFSITWHSRLKLSRTTKILQNIWLLAFLKICLAWHTGLRLLTLACYS